MTLGREDLLQKQTRARLHSDTILASGYIARSQTDSQTLSVVLFSGEGTRFKGYVNASEVFNVIKTGGKAVVKKKFPKQM